MSTHVGSAYPGVPTHTQLPEADVGAADADAENLFASNHAYYC